MPVGEATLVSGSSAQNQTPACYAARVTKTRGFSLVELSIVLVILGLLVGGVLTGQSLIRAAELRSVTTEFQKYQAAVNTFRDKYFALPGDMTNATQFWGAAHATPATCRTTASTTTATCDGNGDGSITSMDGGTTYSEYFRAWQQLANAGLIEGSYTGVAGSGSISHTIPGTNAPRPKMGAAGWGFAFLVPALAGDANFFEGNYGNFLFFGGANASGDPNAALLKPEEQWNIDTKMDDGKPGYGRVRSLENQTNCNTTAVASTAAYNLTFTTAACSAIMLLGI